jgi:hypothetical protein
LLLSFLFARDLVVDRRVYLNRNRFRRICLGMVMPATPGGKIAGLARGRVGAQVLWKIEASHLSICIRDSNGQALAYVYFEDEKGRRMAMRRLARD